MNSREIIRVALKHEEPDRIPIHDTPWDSTITRWKKEGLPKNILVRDFFNFDMALIRPDVTPQYPVKVLQEDGRFIIQINKFGETVKNFKDYSTTPQVIDSPVKNKRDWEILKERLVINNSRLITYGLDDNLTGVCISDQSDTFYWDKSIKQFKIDYGKGRFITFLTPINFDMVQHYLGPEKLLMTIATDPGWISEMFMAHAEFIIKLHGFLVDNGINFDGVFLGSDMGYKNGLLFSPAMYKELFLPVDKLLCDYFHSMDMPVILHSDGNINSLIPSIIEAGFDCIQPLEVKAGMDVRELKKEYGDKLSFMGNIDVRLMKTNDLNKIENEIKNKFEIAKKGGGYIYHSDHSVPNDVSFTQYKKVMEFVNEYAYY